MRNKFSKLFLFFVGTILFLWVGGITFDTSWGHSGRTDSRGGHTDSKTGKYHFHNSGKRGSGC